MLDAVVADDSDVEHSDSLSSSSNDDDFDEPEATVEDVALQAQFEASLAENARQYDVHLQVMTILQKTAAPCCFFKLRPDVVVLCPCLSLAQPMSAA